MRKWVDSFAAAQRGLDTLFLAEGIGENPTLVLTGICDGLSFLGIELDESRDMKHT